MKFKNLLLTTILLFGAVLKSNAQADWNTAGNVGTPSDFMGTTNNSPLIFKINNVFSGNINTGLASFGYDSLKTNNNLGVAFGSYALSNANGSTENSAFGFSSLKNNTIGSFNTALGAYSMAGNVTGGNSVAIGYAALSGNTNGVGNIAIGFESMPGAGSGNISIGYRAFWNSTASGNIGVGAAVLANILAPSEFNVAFGAEAGLNLSTGNGNSYFGRSSGHGSPIIANNTGTGNSFFGYDSGYDISSGISNSFFGIMSGRGITTGSYNTFLGMVNVPNLPSTATSPGNDTYRTIILADGGQQQRLYIHNNGFTGIGLGNNVIPKNTVEIKAVPGSPSPSGTGVSGLRLASLPNGNFNTLTTNATNKVLSVNKFGDVILVDDATGGVTNTCATGNFLPKVNPINTNNFICSQVFDNGTSVGIGTGAQTPAFFNYTGGAGVFGTNWPPFTGTNRLVVNGSTRALAYFVTSDKKFKRDIKSIDSALKTVEALEGKTYFWNKKSNETIEFDDAPHSGFLAQEVEKILPHLVITDEKGNKSVNYLEMIPYLVESIKEQQIQIKEQQAQITELKNTISDNFKSRNDDVIKLENTKIINVSPNPSSDVITVSLNIEKTVQNAKLQVYDLNGTLLSSLNVNERENNVTKTLQKDNFGKGIYIVSLVINGKSIDTKRIIFN